MEPQQSASASPSAAPSLEPPLGTATLGSPTLESTDTASMDVGSGEVDPSTGLQQDDELSQPPTKGAAATAKSPEAASALAAESPASRPQPHNMLIEDRAFCG